MTTPHESQEDSTMSTDHIREIHDYDIQLVPGERVDLRTLKYEDLLDLRKQLADEQPTSLNLQPIFAAIDYLAAGHYAHDLQADAAKAAELASIAALLNSTNAQPEPILSTPVDDGEYHGEYHAAQLRIAELTELNRVQQEQLGKLAPQVAELEEQLTKAGSEILDEKTKVSVRETWLDSARQELDEFRNRVVEVADRYARDNDWCDTVDRALRELDLERAPREVEYMAQVTITFDVIAKRVGTTELPDDGWVRGSINNMSDIESAIDDIQMDGDHDEDATEVRNFRYRVTSVESI